MKSQVVLTGLLAFAAACGSDSSGTPDSGDVVNCQNDSRVTAYTPNMTVNSTGGTMKFSLVQSNPGPPATGNNTWSLKITNTSGTGLPGLSLGYKTIMPDHGHGSPITNPSITDNGGGNYTVTPVDLFMPGVWHVWFFNNATPNDTGDFFFCVQG
ncbi:MAG TPA: FixH family protein [Myxococcales bacterium]|nr:FixH family protein [Myxococcales bacterium]